MKTMYSQNLLLVFSYRVFLLFLVVSISADCKRIKKFYAVESRLLYSDFEPDAACKENGLELATIESESEENFLELYLSKMSSSDSFILNARRGFDGFEWVTDPPKKMNYTKWHQGEPNNFNGRENCLVITRRDDSYGWNDVTCWRSYSFICMKISDDQNLETAEEMADSSPSEATIH